MPQKRTLDGWIKFRVRSEIAGLVFELRSQLTSLLQQKIERPSLELSRAGKGLLLAVTQLLQQQPEA